MNQLVDIKSLRKAYSSLIGDMNLPVMTANRLMEGVDFNFDRESENIRRDRLLAEISEQVLIGAFRDNVRKCVDITFSTSDSAHLETVLARINAGERDELIEEIGLDFEFDVKKCSPDIKDTSDWIQRQVRDQQPN